MLPRPFSNCGTLAKRNCFRSVRLWQNASHFKAALQHCSLCACSETIYRQSNLRYYVLDRHECEAGDASDTGGRCIHGQRAWGLELYNKRVGAGVGVLQLHVSSQQSPLNI